MSKEDRKISIFSKYKCTHKCILFD